LLAVLLTASSAASASLILPPPNEVLERFVERPDPTPSFGPKLHYSVGPEVQVYPRSPDSSGVRGFTVLAFAIPIAVALFVLIPFCQSVALFVRLLD
jgi:hypothetical protein